MGSAYLSLRTFTKYKDKFFNKDVSHLPTIVDNPLLFNKIMDFLDLKSLLKLRLVCSEWNFEILRRLPLNQLCLKIREEEDLLDLIKLNRNHSEGETSQELCVSCLYLKLPRISPSFQQALKGHVLAKYLTDVKVTVNPEDFHRLLDSLTPLENLHNLFIIRLPFTRKLTNFPDLSKTLFSTSSQLCNLKCFKLRDLFSFRNLRSVTASIESDLDLILFLKNIPNIRRMEFQNWVGKIIHIIVASKVYRSLEEIRIVGKPFSEDDVKRLHSLGWNGNLVIS